MQEQMSRKEAVEILCCAYPGRFVIKKANEFEHWSGTLLTFQFKTLGNQFGLNTK